MSENLSPSSSVLGLYIVISLVPEHSIFAFPALTAAFHVVFRDASTAKSACKQLQSFVDLVVEKAHVQTETDIHHLAVLFGMYYPNVLKMLPS